MAARGAQQLVMLAAQARRGQRHRQRAARAPEAHALHRAADPPAAPARYAAAAASEHCASASSSVAHTTSTLSKRLMVKISATTLCSAATDSRASGGAHLLGGDHQHAQAHAADVFDAGEVEHQRALALAGLGQQRCQRGFEIGGTAVVDAAGGRGHDRVGVVVRGNEHGARSWMAADRAGRFQYRRTEAAGAPCGKPSNSGFSRAVHARGRRPRRWSSGALVIEPGGAPCADVTSIPCR